MKKNLYYRSVLRRRNVIKEFIFDYFLAACSKPRLLLEVFIRRNLGERYFSLSTAVLMSVVLAIIPMGTTLGLRALARFGYGRPFEILDFLKHELTWYMFIAGFIAMCIDRQIEIKSEPSVFDFGRYSLSSGDILPMFLNYQPFLKPLSIRTIETIVEPGFFFLIGLGLWLFQQHIGPLIVLCSIFYSLGYFAAYYRGDNFVMDQIDEMIFNEELTSAFIEGRNPSETRGVKYYGRKPIDPEMRRRMAENFVVEDNIVIAL
ncbi:hypothetical protein [Dyadobacter sp. 32]|uniref:hypothetical protein n=1 Tax=Dyadobacter sp. 32 TaxID=538966 RepID=UPI0011ED9366